MPRNRGGERIRVGIVTYSGDEQLRLHGGDRERPLTRQEILRLARRDARVSEPLTSDYRRLRRTLDRLARLDPVGMTDAAAGIGRAVIELLGDEGAESGSRPHAQRVVLFLTDGQPSLPYDRQRAEKAAAYAGRLAEENGIRVNVFALGRNAVTGSSNDAVKRMVRRTGGSYVALENPAEIVTALEQTPLSIVEGVTIVNRTTGRSTRRIAAGIDGSFYGEIPLREGSNQIEVVARLDDGREPSRVFAIDYTRGLPDRELSAQLRRIQLENEALIERIKADMAREIVAARRRQKQLRDLDVSGERPPRSWPAELE